MSKDSFLVRITQVYRYKPDDVLFGAVFVNPSSMSTKDGTHRVMLLTRQSSLNIPPEVGQIWEVDRRDDFAIRREKTSFGGYVDVYRYISPTLKCVMPYSGKAFVDFLVKESAFKNIGRVSAQMLWSRFQLKLFDILEEGQHFVNDGQTNFEIIKEVLLRDSAVSGLFEGYKKYKNLKYASKFVGYEIEVATQQQLFRMAGHDAINYLEANPYRLYSLGMSFEKSDAIAQKYFNVGLNSPLRLKAIVEQALRLWTEQGNTVANWVDILPKVSGLLGGDKALIKEAKAQEGEIIGFVKRGDKYFSSGNYIFEKTVAKRFTKLSKEVWRWGKELEDVYNASKPKLWDLKGRQEQAVRIALTSSLFALSGGAGTGKTTILKVIVDSYRRLGFTVYPVALSGKAAKRLKQSIGIDARTIAKVLHSENPTEQKSVLLIDEASMVDSYTMWRLVTLFPPETRILLVGDPYQLPPINAGFVLSDVIKSRVIPSVELDLVRRQSAQSSIPGYANAIRLGLCPDEMNTPEVAVSHSVVNIVDEAVFIAGQYSNSMIVAATNELVRKVNLAAQKEFNPNGRILDLSGCILEAGSYDFRLNDPVVVTLTSYKYDVQNGTLAKVIDVDPSYEYACTIELEDLDEFGVNRILKVDWDLFEYVELAYCLTLHKMQGSQAENVVVLVNDSRIIDRSWLYTAVTRTENKLHIIAEKGSFHNAISRVGAIDRRKTGLCDMIKENV